MSMTLVQDELHGIMPSLMSQSQPTHHNNFHQHEEYSLNHALELSYSSVRQSPPATHHYNDQEQYPSYEEFDAIVQDYLQNLSSKKRDKALIDQARYAMILQVLKDPRNTAVSTAQFRFWVKKMFQLTPRQIVCHDGKPVAMREQIYGILVRAHREAHHGGRDKTSALVRRRYSWIPKELIARFVRHCPFCISRRNGSQQSPLSLGIFLPATPPTYSMIPNHSQQIDDDDNRTRAPSMITSSSSASSSASYPEEMMLMAAAAAHHQQQQHPDSMSNSAIDLSTWQSNHPYYAANHNSYYNNHSNSNSTKQQSYPMTYSSISDEQQHQQPMMMQPPLSVYYAQEYGLKQTPNYPLLDNNNINTFAAHTNTTTTNRSSSMYYNLPTTTVTSSPSLSPSSSSTSTTSSPVHPTYNESNVNSDYIHSRQQQQQGLNLLSHHQSLF